MNKGRVDLVLRAYSKLDKNGDGQITFEDLKGFINLIFFLNIIIIISNS